MDSVIARYSRPAMANIWSEEAKLARWLEVELAALEAWAQLGVVPAEDVATIRERAAPPRWSAWQSSSSRQTTTSPRSSTP